MIEIGEQAVRSLEELESELTTPSAALIGDFSSLDGDIMVLGAGGKMGPTLCRLAAKAAERTRPKCIVTAVSRFNSADARSELDRAGVQTIAADLLNEGELQKLPEAANIIYMAGRKFGTEGSAELTWAMNSYLPGRVAERFKDSRIVVFSTGNVYPLTPVVSGGAIETTEPNPVGEYGQSCLGRERIFEYFSGRFGTRVLLFRLNYAIEMRYGVLTEIARAVKSGEPIDLTTGNVNCIWQGDANEIALRGLLRASSPPTAVNVTGPETISIRYVANEFGKRFEKAPLFVGEERETTLLSNSAKMVQMFGYPRVSLLQMIDWIAEWTAADGPSWQKPTRFQVREGRF